MCVSGTKTAFLSGQANTWAPLCHPLLAPIISSSSSIPAASSSRSARLPTHLTTPYTGSPFMRSSTSVPGSTELAAAVALLSSRSNTGVGSWW